MGTVFGVIAVLAVLFGIGWLWDEATKKKGAVGAVARGAETVAEGAGKVFRVVIGVGLILVGIGGMIMLWSSGDILLGLGVGLALSVGGIWVLLGGGLTISL